MNEASLSALPGLLGQLSVPDYVITVSLRTLGLRKALAGAEEGSGSFTATAACVGRSKLIKSLTKTRPKAPTSWTWIIPSTRALLPRGVLVWQCTTLPKAAIAKLVSVGSFVSSIARRGSELDRILPLGIGWRLSSGEIPLEFAYSLIKKCCPRTSPAAHAASSSAAAAEPNMHQLLCTLLLIGGLHASDGFSGSDAIASSSTCYLDSDGSPQGDPDNDGVRLILQSLCDQLGNGARVVQAPTRAAVGNKEYFRYQINDDTGAQVCKSWLREVGLMQKDGDEERTVTAACQELLSKLPAELQLYFLAGFIVGDGSHSARGDRKYDVPQAMMSIRLKKKVKEHESFIALLADMGATTGLGCRATYHVDRSS